MERVFRGERRWECYTMFLATLERVAPPSEVLGTATGITPEGEAFVSLSYRRFVVQPEAGPEVPVPHPRDALAMNPPFGIHHGGVQKRGETMGRE